MAVLVEDLLAPQGPVEATLFPDEDEATLTARLQTYLDRAIAKTNGIAFPEPDEAVAAWALHLTFEAAYVYAISRPANENSMVPVLGSEGYAKDQRDALKEKADEYLSLYRGMLAGVPAPAVLKGPQTRAIPNRYEW